MIYNYIDNDDPILQADRRRRVRPSDALAWATALQERRDQRERKMIDGQ